MISSFSTLGSLKKTSSIISSPPISVTVPSTKMPVVIIGTGGSYTYGYSTNLTSWTWGTISPIITPTAICCGNVNSSPLWVIIGVNSGTTYYSTTSTNGTTWTTPSSNISAIFKSTGWTFSVNFGYDKDGSGIFLATGYGGTSGSSSVAISSDGITWVTGGFPFPNTKFGNSCYYGNGYWVVTGNSTYTENCAMYSSSVSIAGNASITWSTVGNLASQPAYGVAYDGNIWCIGTANRYIHTSSNSSPASTYTNFTPVLANTMAQYPSAIMANQNTAMVGGSGMYQYVINYVSPLSSSSSTYSNSAVIPPSRTWQIEYVSTTATYIAALAGNVGGNNSISYFSNNSYPWVNISTVNTNMPVCRGVAASR